MDEISPNIEERVKKIIIERLGVKEEQVTPRADCAASATGGETKDSQSEDGLKRQSGRPPASGPEID